MHNHGENFLVKNGWRFSSGGEKIFLWSILFFSIRQRKNPPPRSFPFQNHNSQIEIVFTWFFGSKNHLGSRNQLTRTKWCLQSLYMCQGININEITNYYPPKSFLHFNCIIWKTNSLPHFKINSGISKSISMNNLT